MLDMIQKGRAAPPLRGEANPRARLNEDLVRQIRIDHEWEHAPIRSLARYMVGSPMIESRPRLISLFDFSGQWSRYFALDGYSVELVDLKHGTDIFTWEPAPGPVDGILAAPPCTEFSGSGAQFWKAKDVDGRTAEALRLVDRCLHLIKTVQPAWYIIENPVGRLGRLRLGKPIMIVNPCEYAGYIANPASEAYTKKTCLWGSFTMGPKAPVEPVMYETADGKRGSWMWAHLGGKSERTKELRSTTPLGIAYATWLGNRSDDPIFE